MPYRYIFRPFCVSEIANLLICKYTDNSFNSIDCWLCICALKSETEWKPKDNFSYNIYRLCERIYRILLLWSAIRVLSITVQSKDKWDCSCGVSLSVYMCVRVCVCVYLWSFGPSVANDNSAHIFAEAPHSYRAGTIAVIFVLLQYARSDDVCGRIERTAAASRPLRRFAL